MLTTPPTPSTSFPQPCRSAGGRDGVCFRWENPTESYFKTLLWSKQSGLLKGGREISRNRTKELRKKNLISSHSLCTRKSQSKLTVSSKSHRNFLEVNLSSKGSKADYRLWKACKKLFPSAILFPVTTFTASCSPWHHLAPGSICTPTSAAPFPGTTVTPITKETTQNPQLPHCC